MCPLWIEHHFVFCQRWCLKASWGCGQVGMFSTLYSCIAVHHCVCVIQHVQQWGSIHQLCSHRSTGGAIPHEMDHRRLTKPDPLWGLHCSLLMWVKSLGSLARQVAPGRRLMCYIPRSAAADFSIRLFTVAVENSTEGLVRGFEGRIRSTFPVHKQPVVFFLLFFWGLGLEWQLYGSDKLRVWLVLELDGKDRSCSNKRVCVVHSLAKECREDRHGGKER